jgi:3',5'-cyclic AMP phosphodiesterase CpdA
VKTIAHISDAHFGAHDSTIASKLLDELNRAEYDVIVVSGDMTQRGRVDQFQAAAMWLDQLTAPVLIVPGNHDVPLYDIYTRFLHPRDRYLAHICDDLEPTYFDSELAICGIDTTKTFTTKYGRITDEQVAHIATKLANLGDRWKIVVAHHPFIVPAGQESERVDGADMALPVFESAGVDMILTGHLHTLSIAGRDEGHRMLAVQAGTCMSTRTRGEAQSYNRLRFDGDGVEILQRMWDGGRFSDAASKSYEWRADDEEMVKVAESVPAEQQASA